MTVLEEPTATEAGHDAHGEHGLSHATSTGVSNEKMAMWAFLGSECLLFGALISTYFLYRGRGPSGGARQYRRHRPRLRHFPQHANRC